MQILFCNAFCILAPGWITKNPVNAEKATIKNIVSCPRQLESKMLRPLERSLPFNERKDEYRGRGVGAGTPYPAAQTPYNHASYPLNNQTNGKRHLPHNRTMFSVSNHSIRYYRDIKTNRATPKKKNATEIHLDYQDFLRQRGLRPRDKNPPESLKVRRKYTTLGSDNFDGSDKSDVSDEPFNLARRKSYLLFSMVIIPVYNIRCAGRGRHTTSIISIKNR